jgi:hypothetical protein
MLNQRYTSIHDLNVQHTQISRPITIDFSAIIKNLDSNKPYSITQQAIASVARHLCQIQNDNNQRHHWPETWNKNGLIHSRLRITPATANMNKQIDVYSKLYERCSSFISHSVMYKDIMQDIYYGDILAFIQVFDQTQQRIFAVINRYSSQGTNVLTNELLLAPSSRLFDVIAPQDMMLLRHKT